MCTLGQSLNIKGFSLTPSLFQPNCYRDIHFCMCAYSNPVDILQEGAAWSIFFPQTPHPCQVKATHNVFDCVIWLIQSFCTPGKPLITAICEYVMSQIMGYKRTRGDMVPSWGREMHYYAYKRYPGHFGRTYRMAHVYRTASLWRRLQLLNTCTQIWLFVQSNG